VREWPPRAAFRGGIASEERGESSGSHAAAREFYSFVPQADARFILHVVPVNHLDDAPTRFYGSLIKLNIFKWKKCSTVLFLEYILFRYCRLLFVLWWNERLHICTVVKTNMSKETAFMLKMLQKSQHIMTTFAPNLIFLCVENAKFLIVSPDRAMLYLHKILIFLFNLRVFLLSNVEDSNFSIPFGVGWNYYK